MSIQECYSWDFSIPQLFFTEEENCVGKNMNGIVENEATENIDKNSMTNDVKAVPSPVSHPVQYLRRHCPAIHISHLAQLCATGSEI